ncbi:hypothetical protein [Azospirillum brasilense]|uniref:hypothetical protein n=1 Tax=Azospirillum brasilense TaxID=192 RepID=UPI0011C42062|nr:hypothetical protein [Azospirillum brasilense]NUB23337.1 hypothetical protein [Azospirillum brasilense]NUB30959.1 hypothetical protein [Azospirillum brasilense]
MDKKAVETSSVHQCLINRSNAVIRALIPCLHVFEGLHRHLTSTRIERIAPPAVPPHLLDCPPEPEPHATAVMQSDVAAWVLDVVEAGRECRQNLMPVKKIMESQELPR